MRRTDRSSPAGSPMHQPGGFYAFGSAGLHPIVLSGAMKITWFYAQMDKVLLNMLEGDWFCGHHSRHYTAKLFELSEK
jgi:hypothetical protein